MAVRLPCGRGALVVALLAILQVGALAHALEPRSDPERAHGKGHGHPSHGHPHHPTRNSDEDDGVIDDVVFFTVVVVFLIMCILSCCVCACKQSAHDRNSEPTSVVLAPAPWDTRLRTIGRGNAATSAPTRSTPHPVHSKLHPRRPTDAVRAPAERRSASEERTGVRAPSRAASAPSLVPRSVAVAPAPVAPAPIETIQPRIGHGSVYSIPPMDSSSVVYGHTVAHIAYDGNRRLSHGPVVPRPPPSMTVVVRAPPVTIPAYPFHAGQPVWGSGEPHAHVSSGSMQYRGSFSGAGHYPRVHDEV